MFGWLVEHLGKVGRRGCGKHYKRLAEGMNGQVIKEMQIKFKKIVLDVIFWIFKLQGLEIMIIPRSQ